MRGASSKLVYQYIQIILGKFINEKVRHGSRTKMVISIKDLFIFNVLVILNKVKMGFINDLNSQLKQFLKQK